MVRVLTIVHALTRIRASSDDLGSSSFLCRVLNAELSLEYLLHARGFSLSPKLAAKLTWNVKHTSVRRVRSNQTSFSEATLILIYALLSTSKVSIAVKGNILKKIFFNNKYTCRHNAFMRVMLFNEVLKYSPHVIAEQHSFFRLCAGAKITSFTNKKNNTKYNYLNS